MSKVMDQLTERQEQFLDLATRWQEPVVDGVRRTASVMDRVVPERFGNVPFADRLPTATELIENQYAFAKEWMQLNHDFALSVAEASRLGKAPASAETKTHKPTSANAAKAKS
ncbi:MAG: hypothetical protein S0880_24400 [Actinomycetota bacterium]|nr:hypothetical protein [Actinomycetota bacterium]